jgi:hypothetical protein
MLGLALTAPAFAGPGSPGLDSAQVGVYGGPDTGTEGERLGGEQGQGQEAEGGEGAVEGVREANAIVAGVGEEDAGLPFTGFSAALVLGGALVLLLGGAALRVLSRPRSR